MAEQQTTGTAKASRWSLTLGGDKVLWVIVIAFAFVSMLIVYSSTTSSLYGVSSSGNHITRLLRQFVDVAIGFATVWVVHKFDYQIYMRAAKFSYVVALLFMVLTFFFGVNKFGAQRWLMIPIVGITFQPSDFLKVATVVLLALQLAHRQMTVQRISLIPNIDMWRRNRAKAFEVIRHQTLPVFGPIVLSCLMIVPENMSTALLMGATCVIMLIIGRVKWSDVFRFVALVAVGGALLYGTLKVTGQMPERSGTWKKRVLALVSPDKVRAEDPDYFYQVDQAKIAIAMGGVTGRGAGESVQRHYLPKAESDYAFAFLIEEYGLMGAILVIVLYLWIFYRAIVIFAKCGTAFPCLLVLGLALLITFQAMLNMMVSTQLMFQTGLTLPFISKGGSSELFTSLALGMILGVSRQAEERTLSTPRNESMLENNK